MPIYEYQCAACGELHEALQKISDPPLTDCPACGKAALRKKVSAVAFRLKGSGWYETDFKSGDKKNLAGDSDGAKDGAKNASSEGGDAPGGGDSGAKSGRESDGKSRNRGGNKSENNSRDKPRSSAESADKTPAGPASKAGGAARS